ncbi:MAG: 4-hydroxy-3-methylbut-2-enyl diphosphate reductase [Chitinophagaceae bacterium]
MPEALFEQKHMKSFDIPAFYRSPLISGIKEKRKKEDKLKKDFTPTVLDVGNFEIKMARHFGFCYGVENAIEIAFRTVQENPNKRIFLLSEMIHNPQVNADLMSYGVQFIMNTKGEMYINWENLKQEDIVIIPAFGTTLETENKLRQIGINPLKYNTTCPFVEKVWNRSQQIGNKGYTIIIHGKPQHEETRATFSHTSSHSPSIVVNDMHEAKKLALYLTQQKEKSSFYEEFRGQYSTNFDIEKDFERIGVVNQTTMLASDTQEIADYLKNELYIHYKLDDASISTRFADTRDTLCYATNDNQQAVKSLLNEQADLALVVGGFNSSNTSHLVELCESILPTFFIENDSNLIDKDTIKHFDLNTHQIKISTNIFPLNKKPSILLTAGASCPDAVVENVIKKLIQLFQSNVSIEDLQNQF